MTQSTNNEQQRHADSQHGHFEYLEVKFRSSIDGDTEVVLRSGPTTKQAFTEGDSRTNLAPRDIAVTPDIHLRYPLIKRQGGSSQEKQTADWRSAGPLNTLIAVTGNAERTAMSQGTAEESIGDVLQMTGSVDEAVDDRRPALECMEDIAANRLTRLNLQANKGKSLTSGQLLRKIKFADMAWPIRETSKRVCIEDEVTKPEEYVSRPDSSVADALRQATGITQTACFCVTVFSRESGQVTPQLHYERAFSIRTVGNYLRPTGSPTCGDDDAVFS